MKINIWIRPDPNDPTGRKATMRLDYKLEDRDTPGIQHYGKKLMNALEGMES